MQHALRRKGKTRRLPVLTLATLLNTAVAADTGKAWYDPYILELETPNTDAVGAAHTTNAANAGTTAQTDCLTQTLV